MIRILALLPILLLLNACQPSLQADVTRFYTAPPVVAGQSVLIMAAPGSSETLEFRQYAALVGQALMAQGLHPVPAGGPAPDLLLLLGYGSAGSHTEIYSEPAGSGGFTPRRGWNALYPGTVSSQTYYSQYLEVSIYGAAAGAGSERPMLFQGRALSESAARDLNISMPYLVKALFDGFPGINGQTVRVVLPIGDAP